MVSAIDFQRAALHFAAIERFSGSDRRSFIQFNKTKSSWPASIPVVDKFCAMHGSVGFEEFAQLFLRSGEGQVADVK